MRRSSTKARGVIAPVIFLTVLVGLLVQPAGAATTAALVKDIFPGSANSLSTGAPGSLANVNGTLFFWANDGTHGIELWKSDGTAGGTVLVKDINPGTADSPGGGIGDETRSTLDLTNVNGTLFFSANDGIHGRELWKSNGTEIGTVMVRDINGVNVQGSFVRYITNVNGTAFFRACDDLGCGLFTSDGTEAGTVRVSGNIGGDDLTNVNGTVFFRAGFGSVFGRELWKSDGTEAGTVLVKDINPGSGESFPASLANVNETLFFSANDGSHGREPWKSDGTEAGTVLVKDIDPGSEGSLRFEPADLANVAGTLFLGADDGTTGVELWKSNGTVAGTVLVKDINLGSANFGGSFPHELTDVNGTLFFSADDFGTNGRELWKSDGSTAGTVLVKDILPGSVGSAPHFLTNVNGTVFFSAEGTAGRELWKSDGTEAGTVQVMDIFPGFSGSSPAVLTNVNGTLFFGANDGTHGIELWKVEAGGGIIPGLDGAIDMIVNGPTKSRASGGSRKVFVTKACNVGTVDITVNPADISTSRTVNGSSAEGTVTLLTDPTPMLLGPGACQRYRWEWSYGEDGPLNPGDTVVYEATWSLAGDGLPANNTDSETRTAT